MERLAGRFESRLDPQGRLVLPRVHREILKGLSWQRLYWLPQADGGLLIGPPEVEEREMEIRRLHSGAWLDDQDLLEELEELRRLRNR